MKKKNESIDFSHMLSGRRLPIVILDERWHQLFEKRPKSLKVLELERKVNDLLKRQGKLVDEVKSMKAAKHQLLEGIVANMNVDTTPEGKMKERKLAKSQKLVQDLNEKLKSSDNELAEIPYKIKDANATLVIQGMNECYQTLDENKAKIDQLSSQINAMREELKRMIVQKQEMEEVNTSIYAYMHDVLGSDIIELFDSYYQKRR